MKKLVFGIIIVMLAGVAFWYWYGSLETADLVDPKTEKLSVSYTNASSDVIVVENIQPGDTVHSPMTVRGQVRGYWMFEASFPIELVDEDGTTLARSYASTEESWMTEDFISFVGELTFDMPEQPIQGTLVLKKDNPSALPENGASLTIPVFISR